MAREYRQEGTALETGFQRQNHLNSPSNKIDEEIGALGPEFLTDLFLRGYLFLLGPPS